ncbi:MAG: hypothetical protein H6621_05340 [Halobacteriovoraceae bacterium]|nr:hypothetical protein [Halobacteriovoraceae bacterium]
MKDLSIFIDTSTNCHFGLLDEKYQWVEYQKTNERPSLYLHENISKALAKYNLSFSELKNYFIVKGPGSYTGLRFAEGISQFLSWNKKNVLGFYFFELLESLENEKTAWLSNAFKNQFYIHPVGEEGKLYFLKDALVKIQELKNDHYDFFTNDKVKNVAVLGDLNLNFFEDVLKDNSKILFPRIIEMNKNNEIFYFRPLEEEFKK